MKALGVISRVQIKSRVVQPNSKGQMVGRINTLNEWDTVMLVLLDE